MDLIQRKRIVNKFNTGTGDYSYLDQKVGAVTTQGTANDLKQMIGSNSPSSAGGSPSFTIGQKPFLQWNSFGGMGSSGFNYKDAAYNNAYALGDMFSQSGKFGDKTSNDIRNYGGAVSKMIPGKYGKLAQGLTDIASDTIGMANYKINSYDMRNQAGTSESTINGIGYTRQNAIDTQSAYKDVKSTGVKNAISSGFKGSAAGFAVGGPIGAIVGGVLGNVLGIFGGRKAAIRQKRINRNAQMQNMMLNQQQMAYADTEGLQSKYYQDNYDTTGSVLYANRGKDLRSRKRFINRTKV